MTADTAGTSTRTLAEKADPLALYERAVQCPETEVDFLVKWFARLRGRPARSLREDFCGTAAVCCEWVRRDIRNTAVGIDIDPQVLAWARRQNLGALSPQAARRVTLTAGNVLTICPQPADIIVAMNFSYWLIMQRHELLAYFISMREQLTIDGIVFLDAYGGYDSFRTTVEEREIDDARGRFTYIWEQSDYNPIDGTMSCHIHFRFADGSSIEPAFSYRWRLWTLPEIRDLLTEAGFSRITCYWQGWDENGEPDGRFEPAETADADAAWIAYISAER